MKGHLAKYYPGILLLLISMAVGAWVYDDYGMAWDEPAQRLIGQVNYNYIFNHDPALLSFYDKEYGAAFELPLIFIEKLFHLKNLRDIYIARHLATHFFFLIGAFSFYVLTYNIFRKQWLAVLGFLMLVLMPRIYAHSFFNTKDIPFLSALIIALTLCHAAFIRRRPVLFLAAGIASGYFVGIRIMGVIPLSFMGLFLLWDAAEALIRKREQKKTVFSLLLFIAGFCCCLYAVWPFLWSHPIDNLKHCLEKLAHKEYPQGNLIIGTKNLSADKQWKYLPVWFSITVPLLWLITGLAGMVAVVVTLTMKPVRFMHDRTERSFILFLSCFAVPAVAVIAFHSAIYDEWRHLYFIYPPFVLLGLYFINKSATKWKEITITACSVQIVLLICFMIKHHPYQYVYFNNAVPHKEEYLRKNYEFDYWGISVQQALRCLLASDHNATLKIYNPDFEPYIKNNVSILPANERDRIKLCSIDECNYFITTFRYHPEDFNYPVFYKIRVLNSTVVCIYKIR